MITKNSVGNFGSPATASFTPLFHSGNSLLYSLLYWKIKVTRKQNNLRYVSGIVYYLQFPKERKNQTVTSGIDVV